MTLRFHHVGLVGKYLRSTVTQDNARAAGTPPELLLNVARCLEMNGCQVVLESRTAEMAELDRHYPSLEMVEIGQQCDLAVVVGGDGTMLGAARSLATSNVPLIGINQGRVGFITDIPLGQVHEVLPSMLHGEFIEDGRAMMHGKVMRQGTCVFESLAVNDVVINRGSTAGMVELCVEVDGHFVSKQRADGLIVSTPTGATAYSLSAGGPLLHPAVPGWVMVPIAPHTLSNRPIVLSDQSTISIELVAGRKASANFDTQSLSALQSGDRVVVSRSRHMIHFLHPSGWNYYDTLRQKLHWNKGSN